MVEQVHPPAWRNPEPSGRYNLVVIGGGTAGLVSAAGGAGLGAKVALVERHLLGGDCLNVGCVPSKALLHAAHVAAEARAAARAGVAVGDVAVDFPAVMERMRRLRAQIAPNDGAPRLAGLGVDVFLGEARFTSRRRVEVDGRVLEFSRAVIATGGRASAPEIPGLAEAGYLTNETIFSLTELPSHLLVLGAGPIGCEMAQAFARFGSRVTLLQDTEHVLPREDRDAAEIVERHLRRDGVAIFTGIRVVGVERRDEARVVSWEQDGERRVLECDQILVAAGRVPNVEGLGLDAAGVAASPHGIAVDDFLRTSNRRVYAAGDVASRFKFTHTALARIVLTNGLFLGRKRASALLVPWCTYTSPEVAHECSVPERCGCCDERGGGRARLSRSARGRGPVAAAARARSDAAGQRRPALRPRVPSLPRRGGTEAHRVDGPAHGGPRARAARAQPRGRGPRSDRRRARAERELPRARRRRGRARQARHRSLQPDGPARAGAGGDRRLPRRSRRRDRRLAALLHRRARRRAAWPRRLRAQRRSTPAAERAGLRAAGDGSAPRPRLQPDRRVPAAAAGRARGALPGRAARAPGRGVLAPGDDHQHGAPPVLNRSYTMTAEVEIPQGGAEGMLVTDGGHFGGYGFYLLKGRPVFTWNRIQLAIVKWQGKDAVVPGKHKLEFDWKYEKPGLGQGGTGTLKVDGKAVDSHPMPKSLPVGTGWVETFNVGIDTGTPVDLADYQVPFRFTGKLDKVTVKLGPEELTPAEQEMIFGMKGVTR